ncbi:MAG: hypothetical protein A2637_05395 [Candidatus Muproteobacteria bacterium RIFCSPHIGHO2_01_FULL_65_16]|uniref:Nucleotidyltransferase family protein n=2 Tax=Candidatus Muproteobacteria TaxID=1817795 RepID=A0A1F6TN60_9PROT|nr:MAG: hypothetical protein A2637_05395 [Candidatus Muproteobacteria bacterium RIFCSPHIGHO2_01_FULL_65_16]OGI50704.1 MAG: hypothetical protein A3B81_03020 [Candidatus Muproteobacteria bacterium RIFCSPHIGHO2_02_FULL_65_16]
MLTELEVLRDVGERLEKGGIEYMLTGSVAMNYYAEPRMTRDIDLVVALDPTDAPRLRALFEPDYYVPPDLEQAIRSRGMFNLVHIESVVKVDIIVRKDDAYRRVEFGRRRSVELPDFHAWIASKEDLILSKLIWAKDSASELQLRDVRNLLASGADDEYLREWAARLGVAELLEKCRHA